MYIFLKELKLNCQPPLSEEWKVALLWRNLASTKARRKGTVLEISQVDNMYPDVWWEGHFLSVIFFLKTHELNLTLR